MSESRFVAFVRRSIYNRWFYAFLALVCLINVVSEILDITDPGENLAVDVASLVSSGIAAVLTAIVFFDLRSRREKL